MDGVILLRAHQRAQRRLSAMIDAKTYGDPQATETRLYTQAERLVDALLVELGWEQQKAELDALITADLTADADVEWRYSAWVEPELREAFGR
jgi:hypothetical protein